MPHLCDTGDPFKMIIYAERFVVFLSIPVFTSYVCHGRGSSTQTSACKANILTDCTTAAVIEVNDIDKVLLSLRKSNNF